MRFISILTSPPTLLFLIVVIGYLLGKIRIGGISLGISAVLLTSIAFGYILSRLYPDVIDTYFTDTMSAYSKLGTTLFISVIGITSGYEICKVKNRKSLLYFILGVLMVLAGFTAAKIISLVDRQIDISVLMGILCGALTSTPALAAACESQAINSGAAALGYSAAYLFGVFGVVVFVQLSARKSNMYEKNRIIEFSSKDKPLENLFVIAVASIIGQLIAGLKIPYINISLGSSGGVLICGIIAGYIAGKLLKRDIISENSINVYRNMGLILFFVGTGISAGERLNASLEIKYFIYGAFITISSILLGEIICKLLLKIEPKTRMSIIAGGMTSTPAMGVLLKRNGGVNATAYSMAYLGALICIVFGVRIIHI